MRRLQKFLMAATFFMVIPAGQACADTFDSAGREGVSHYNANQYDKAADKFQEAQVNQPENPEVLYNLANARYRLGQYEAAVEDYASVIAQTPDTHLKQQAIYNQGNAYFRLGYLEEAVEAYKKALEMNSSDEDSKYNLEYAQKKLEKAKQSGQMAPRDMNQKKQNSNKNQPPPNPPEENPQTADQKSEESEEKNDSDNAPQDNDESKEESKEQMAQNKPTTPQSPETSTPEDKKMKNLLHEMAPMSREEAERWLDSLNENVKKYKKRQMQGEMQDLFNDPQKDW